MTHSESSFDADEWLHLALHASATNNPHACMTYLKELLKQEPRHASALYLMAVQHAEIGLTKRAIGGMEAALALEPRLEMARFQLGLLLLDGKAAAAREHFTMLKASSDAALRGYAEALIALSEGNTALAREKLALELSRPAGNSALSVLMQRLLDRLASGDQKKSQPEEPGNEIFLGAYRNASS